MPEFPKPDLDLTQEQALTMILSSIALEELALSHIINAEGEKIQYILNKANVDGCCTDLNSVIAVNKSVTDLMEIVLQNQMILKNKMDGVLRYLPKPPCPPDPPCPPVPPRPPTPPCSLDPPCPAVPLRPPVQPCTTETMQQICLSAPVCISEEYCSSKCSIRFGVMPKTYYNNEPLLWTQDETEEDEKLLCKNCTKIQIPYTGIFTLDLYVDVGNLTCSCNEINLLIKCGDKEPIIKRLLLNKPSNTVIMHKKAVFQMLCSKRPCYASILICTPNGVHIRQGKGMFTRL